MLDFYPALGFEVTYQQSKPNNYAVVRRGGIELHFFSMRDYVPANSYSTCYVRVFEIDDLYREFCDGLKQKYGRVPTAGIPRVLPLKNKNGRREFIVVDPGGNWIRIGQIIDSSAKEEKTDAEGTAPTKLSRATHAAILLDETGYCDQAAQKLDGALDQSDSFPVIHRGQALVLRTALAITMEDYDGARQRMVQFRQISLLDDERAKLKDELERADGLEQMLFEATGGPTA
ncbi:hypothetical protein IAD21_01922 [Abditibacteriota bacterium]|nr:hypothetical protein IAD21_01922 [Abditibacteriota bacterium]